MGGGGGGGGGGGERQFVIFSRRNVESCYPHSELSRASPAGELHEDKKRPKGQNKRSRARVDMAPVRRMTQQHDGFAWNSENSRLHLEWPGTKGNIRSQ